MQCKTPFVKRVDGSNMAFPCGKCPFCLARRVSGWSFRLLKEEKESISSYFITLTYDTPYVPITPKGFMALSKRDVQLFFKRLRKLHTEVPEGGAGYSGRGDFERRIKYYAVGEYGSRTMRPHYHLILFNARVELIQPAWGIGHVHYGEVNGASVGYTLKYMSKPGKIPVHVNDDRVPEFSLMSKGLGKSYLTEEMRAWHEADLYNRMYCNLNDGRKIAMPRYYKLKLYTDADREAIGQVMRKRMEDEVVKMEQDPGFSYRNQVEGVKAAFAKMYKDSLRNREKI